MMFASIVVSIPAGFSDALRLYADYDRISDFKVSIPAGFSDALRHYGVCIVFKVISFNPCWVF